MKEMKSMICAAVIDDGDSGRHGPEVQQKIY